MRSAARTGHVARHGAPFYFDKFARSNVSPVNWVNPGYVITTFAISGGGVGGSNSYIYQTVNGLSSYTVQSGDVLEYGVNWRSGPQTILGIGVDFITGSGNYLRGSTPTSLDQNGLGSHPSTDLTSRASGKWYDRSISLSGFVGQSITEWWLACEGDTVGSYVAWFREIRVVNAGVTKFTVYTNSSTSATSAPSTSASGTVSGGSLTSITVVPATPDAISYVSPLSGVNTGTAKIFSGSATGVTDDWSFGFASVPGLGKSWDWTWNIKPGGDRFGQNTDYFGPVFRYVDSNNFCQAIIYNSFIAIQQMVAGSVSTLVTTAQSAYTSPVFPTLAIRMAISGNTLYYFINGTNLGSVTVANAAGTGMGYRGRGSEGVVLSFGTT